MSKSLAARFLSLLPSLASLIRLGLPLPAANAACVQEPPTSPPAARSVATTTALERGIAACNQGDLKTAERELASAVKASPKSAEALGWYGYVLVCRHQASEAIPYLKRAAALEPKPDTFANLGSAYAQVGQTEKSVAAYRQAATLAPKDGRSWINLGIGLQRLNRTEEAADALRKGVALQPQEAGAWALLGALELQHGETALAIRALETARKLDPTNAPALSNLGLAYVQANRYADAAGAYGAAADVAEKKQGGRVDLTPRYNQGVVLAKAGRLEEASAAYDRVLAVDGKHYDTLVNSGFLLYRQGKTDAAIARFMTATAVQPDTPLAWTNLATAYEQKKDTVNAAAAWRKAAALEPTSYTYREYLATDLKRLGQYEALIGVYKEMAALRPTSAEPYNLIGLAYQSQADGLSQPAARQAKLQQALSAFREAANRDPKSAAAYNNQGVVYERLGQPERALAAYHQALALDPNLADAKQNLARYKSAPRSTATP